MRLRYTYIGFVVAIIISILFGSLDFMSDPIKYCQQHIQNFHCTIPFLKDFVLWFSTAFSNFIINRLIIWLATSLPILIGFLLDIKSKQK